MDIPPTTSYVSRVVTLDASTARRAFDAARREREHPASPHVWTLRGAAGALRLQGAGIPTRQVGRTEPFRAASGHVLAKRLKVPVVLELGEWSRTRTELGLRCMTNRASGRYPEIAAEVIEAFAGELELRGLLDTDLRIVLMG